MEGERVICWYLELKVRGTNEEKRVEGGNLER